MPLTASRLPPTKHVKARGMRTTDSISHSCGKLVTHQSVRSRLLSVKLRSYVSYFCCSCHIQRTLFDELIHGNFLSWRNLILKSVSDEGTHIIFFLPRLAQKSLPAVLTNCGLISDIFLKFSH